MAKKRKCVYCPNGYFDDMGLVCLSCHRPRPGGRCPDCDVNLDLNSPGDQCDNCDRVLVERDDEEV